MVNAGMELPGAPHSLDLMDLLADDGGDPPEGSGGAPPAVPQAETLVPTSSSWHPGSCFPQESVEGAGRHPEGTPGRSSETAQPCTEPPCSAGSPPSPKILDFLSEDRGQPQPERSGSGSSDATQALFWASILQAQRCVLDLEGEMGRQREPAAEGPAWAPLPPDSVASHEPLRLESDSEEDSVERQEEDGDSEEEEEEEEMEHLFYNNPLFQESPRLDKTGGLDGPALWGGLEGDAPMEEEEEEEEADASGSSLIPDSLCNQAQVATSPVAGAFLSVPEWDTACLVPAYMPHYRSSSPLVITEGEAESDSPCMEDREVPGCTLEQLAHGNDLESTDPGPSPGADVPGEGLLFSASSTALLSALLHDPPKSCRPPQPPPAAESFQPPSNPWLFPAPAAEQRLWQEDLGPPVPPGGSPSPPCTWVEEPDSASCPEEEVAATELRSSALSGAAGTLEGSVEGLEMVEVPSARRADDETLVAKEEEEEEEEEELPALHGPEEECSPGPLGGTEEPQPTSEQSEPPGADLPPQLVANGTSGDQAAARRLATRLYHLDGFKKSQVASFLRKNNEFSQMVAEAFLAFFQFGGQTLDQALRLFLKAFVLTGETQERERILRHFSQRYHSCNREVFRSSDAVHTLTCAIMLLNTDLHGQNVGRSMTCQEFLANLEGLNEGQNFPKEQLKALYHSIRHEKLEWAMDEQDEDGSSTSQPAAPGNALSLRKNNNPFLTLSHDPAAQIYWQGLLARKVHAEADGKKTPWGKRGWKVFHTVLKGVVLYFFKDESRPEVLGAEEPIGVHHALAERACKYTKRPHVFRLQTADWRVVLFQASTPEEMNSWISRINLVAAMFSSTPFPAAVGSQRKFVRPILPTAPSKSSLVRRDDAQCRGGQSHLGVLTPDPSRCTWTSEGECSTIPLSLQEDQHQAHERWADQMADELLEHQRNLPDKNGRARDLEEYRLKKEYLLYEVGSHRPGSFLCPTALGSLAQNLPPTPFAQQLKSLFEVLKRRYETYVRLLEAKLSCATDDLSQWEAQLGEVDESHGLKKSHSSPSLNADGQPGAVKVKRNISERRTVRKIIPRRNKHLL
ncbi:hypothetical protein lerEdw1_019827 [Lerista edwardsae]|nr:hypothetical protein lerEdw1_019827 [Lerista edwardsae]